MNFLVTTTDLIDRATINVLDAYRELSTAVENGSQPRHLRALVRDCKEAEKTLQAAILAPTPAGAVAETRTIALQWTRNAEGHHVAEFNGFTYTVVECSNEKPSIRWLATVGTPRESHRWMSDGEPRLADAKALCDRHASHFYAKGVRA